MASFWIFEPPGTGAGTAEAVNGAVIVRDGWSWGALLLGPIWPLWRRLWLFALFWLVLIVGAAAASAHWPWTAPLTSIALTLFGIWFALEANALRAASLVRRGYRLAAVAVGRNGEEAEQRYVYGVQGAPAGGAAPPGPPLARTEPPPLSISTHTAPAAPSPTATVVMPPAQPATQPQVSTAPAVEPPSRAPGVPPAMPRVTIPFAELPPLEALRKAGETPKGSDR